LNTDTEEPSLGNLRVIEGGSAPRGVQRGGANLATARRLDPGLDSDPMTLEQLEQLLDVALDAGRIEVAKRLRDRIRGLRG